MMRALVATVLLVAGCAAPEASVPFPKPDETTAVKTASGLGYTIEKPGAQGAKVASAGQRVHVNYAGWLTSGKLFDSSYSRGLPIDFKLGTGAVIKGWDEGVAGMAVGERRKLVIPSSLGYGASGGQGIPGGATLLFVVELVSIDP